MNTETVTILSVIGLLAILAVACIIYSENKKLAFISAFFLFALVAVLISLVVVLTMQNAQLKGAVDGKCPEYEKIENVYKLKQ